MHGSVDLYVEDAVDMSHGDVHTYTLDMDGISTSAYDGDMKVGTLGGLARARAALKGCVLCVATKTNYGVH